MLILLHKCEDPIVLGAESGGSFCVICRHPQDSDYRIDREQREKESESQCVGDVALDTVRLC